MLLKEGSWQKKSAKKVLLLEFLEPRHVLMAVTERSVRSAAGSSRYTERRIPARDGGVVRVPHVVGSFPCGRGVRGSGPVDFSRLLFFS